MCLSVALWYCTSRGKPRPVPRVSVLNFLGGLPTYGFHLEGATTLDTVTHVGEFVGGKACHISGAGPRNPNFWTLAYANTVSHTATKFATIYSSVCVSSGRFFHVEK